MSEQFRNYDLKIERIQLVHTVARNHCSTAIQVWDLGIAIDAARRVRVKARVRCVEWKEVPVHLYSPIRTNQKLLIDQLQTINATSSHL